MTRIDPDLKLRLVAEAARSPSAHNAQPARWRLSEDGRVTLFEALGSRLTVGDPEGWDAGLSLGTAFEGMAIAAASAGLRLSEPRRLAPEHGNRDDPPGLARIAEASLSPGSEEDPLAPWVARRRTHRGKFRPAEPELLERLRELLDRSADLVGIFDPGDRIEIGRRHDHCTWQFMRRPDYHAELHRWMRFSPSHPAWGRDGLSADCLGVSAIEQRLAGVALSPTGFRWVRRLGLGPAITAERSQVRSAAALVLLHGRPEGDPLDHGRRFYRVWLELTAIGLHACPMSTVLECDHGTEYLARFQPPGRRLVKLLRVGPVADPETVGASRRLPAEELLV